jgi:sec-independent protein translocase protein TatA
MLDNLGGIHLVIILAIVVLLFGATKLPALSKAVAQSIRIFKNESKSDPASATAPAAGSNVAGAAPATPAPGTSAPTPFSE